MLLNLIKFYTTAPLDINLNGESPSDSGESVKLSIIMMGVYIYGHFSARSHSGYIKNFSASRINFFSRSHFWVELKMKSKIKGWEIIHYIERSEGVNGTNFNLQNGFSFHLTRMSITMLTIVSQSLISIMHMEFARKFTAAFWKRREWLNHIVMRYVMKEILR